MAYRTTAVLVVVLAAITSTATGRTGSSEGVAYDIRLPDARMNPLATLAQFDRIPVDNHERKVLFMLLMTLGKEQLIPADDFRKVIDRGLVDLHAPIRAFAVHNVDVVYNDEELQGLYRRCTLDKSPYVRYEAADKMRDSPSQRSLPYLQALLDDDSLEVRHVAALSLCVGHRKGNWPNVKDDFIRDLESDNIRLAGAAAYALNRIFHAPARPEILNALLDDELDRPTSSVAVTNVLHLIQLLETIDDSTFRAVLERAARHPDRNIAATARKALLRLQLKPD